MSDSVKQKPGFVRMTLAGAILFLVPLVLLHFFIEKALRLAHLVVDPMAFLLPDWTLWGMHTARMAAIVLLVAFCFLAGLFTCTRLARKMRHKLENSVAGRFPGSGFLISIAESIAGVQEEESSQVVVARFGETWQIGFLRDRFDNGLVSVFIPGPPSASSGSLYVMAADQIMPAGIPAHKFFKYLHRFGAGSREILSKLPLAPDPASSPDNPQSS